MAAPAAHQIFLTRAAPELHNYNRVISKGNKLDGAGRLFINAEAITANFPT